MKKLRILLLAMVYFLCACTAPAPAQPIAAQANEPPVQQEQPLLQESIVKPEETTKPMEEQEAQKPVKQILSLADRVTLFAVQYPTYTDGHTRYISAEAFAVAAGIDYQEYDGKGQFSGEKIAAVFEEDDKIYTSSGIFPLGSCVRSENGRLYLPLDAFCDALGYARGATAQGVQYVAHQVPKNELPADVNVPVLMYHAVSDDCWGYDELFVRPEQMEKQLQYLLENGYDPIWFEDLYELEKYDKPVILTFDDGYDDNYTELYPLLQKYHVKATIFVIAERMDREHKMTSEQVRELAWSNLVSIQSHSCTHPDLDTLDEAQQQYELEESQKILAALTGKKPSVICYPTGRYNETTIEIAEDLYTFGLKMNGYLYNTSDDPLQVNRYYVSRSMDVAAFSWCIQDSGT